MVRNMTYKEKTPHKPELCVKVLLFAHGLNPQRQCEKRHKESSKGEKETKRGLSSTETTAAEATIPSDSACYFPRSVSVGVGSRASARGIAKFWSPLGIRHIRWRVFVP